MNQFSWYGLLEYIELNGGVTTIVPFYVLKYLLLAAGLFVHSAIT